MYYKDVGSLTARPKKNVTDVVYKGNMLEVVLVFKSRSATY